MTPTSPPPFAVTTEFLGCTMAARLVAQAGILQVLRGMAQAIEADFARWQDFEKRPRVAHHSGNGVIELMPVSDAQSYSFKYVNGHPVNTHQGLPTVMAFGALASMVTGVPEFLAELTLTTALRTAAMSALVARHLARPDSQTMALIGNGSQSEFQALGFLALLNVRKLQLHDIDPCATEKLYANLAPYGFEITRCQSTAQAVQGADIVTTLTADKRCATILHAEQVEAGMHINAVGGDCPGKTELAIGVLRRGRVFVEYEPQTRIEGELQQMPADFAVTEFWRVITGEVPGRLSAEEVTIFDSVGFALEDYSALRYMRELGRQAGLLEKIPLIPDLADPKDLYSLLSPWLSPVAITRRVEPTMTAEIL